MDQKGCQYNPHVLGIMVGQTLQAPQLRRRAAQRHALPKVNTPFNMAMPADRARTADSKFGKEEGMFLIKCDVHRWMTAYVGVFANPFFSVTGTDGKFTISGLPPGTYEIEAWHEKLGTQTTKVTVAAAKPAAANFKFAPPAEVTAANRRSMPKSYQGEPWPPLTRARSHEAAHEHAHHEHLGFWRKYIFSVDHKVIGIQYAVTGLLFLFFGFCLMMLMRWQLAYPGPRAAAARQAARRGAHARAASMLPEFYNELGAMHGTIMVFLGVVPLAVGGFGNFVLPLQIGAPDMAFPRLNMASYWSYFLGGMMMLASFFVPGGAAQSGWTSYPPLSVIAGHGPDGVAASAWCFLITSLAARRGQLHRHHHPAARAGPHLLAPAVLRLGAARDRVPAPARLPAARGRGGHAADGPRRRHSFFLPTASWSAARPLPVAGGGNPLLWQHLFWFLAHPEVYVLILPAWASSPR